MQNETFNDSEILQYLKEQGKIDTDIILQEMQMAERTKYLNMHPYDIWKGSGGNYYTYFPDEKTKEGRVRKKRKNKKDLEDLIVKFWKAKTETITVEDVFTEWNERRLQLGQIKPSTHDRNLRIFNRHFSEFGKRDIKQINPIDINDFLEEELSEKHLKAKAFSNLKGLLRGTFKRAQKRGLINFSVEQVFMDMDISERCFNYDHKKDEEQVFDEGQFSILSQYLKNQSDIRSLGIMLLFISGLRVGELVTLKWSDFTDDTYKHFKVQRTETTYKVNGKNVYDVKPPKTQAGYRTVTIPDECVWIIKELHKINPFSEYIFTEKGERLKSYQIRYSLYKICDELGIERKSPHKARKTYASILLDHGVDNAFITSQLGHTDIECTETFYHKDRKSDETKSAIVNGIPEFDILGK